MKKNVKFSVLDRKKTVDAMSKDSYDLVVIGGGITGGGIALDAASEA